MYILVVIIIAIYAFIRVTDYQFAGFTPFSSLSSTSTTPYWILSKVCNFPTRICREISQFTKQFTIFGFSAVTRDQITHTYDALRRLLRNTSDAGGLLTLTTAGGTASVSSTFGEIHDANGNISEYIDLNTGNVESHHEYDAFGNVTTSTGTAPCSFGFSTKYLDAETDLLYYGFRYYNAEKGRWVSRDPINEIGARLRMSAINNADIFRFNENKNIGLYIIANIEAMRKSVGDMNFVSNDSIGKFDFLGMATCECPSGSKKGKKAIVPNPAVVDNRCTNVPNLWFLSACQSHDQCYATCNNSKGGCDSSFYSDMLNICDGLNIALRNTCRQTALAYYTGVVALGSSGAAGDQSFPKLQDQACEDCCCP